MNIIKYQIIEDSLAMTKCPIMIYSVSVWDHIFSTYERISKVSPTAIM